MLREITRNRLMSMLEDRVGPRASPLLMGRLRSVVQGMDGDPRALDDGLKKIRVAVKLFVDEGLAEDLHSQMCELLHGA